MLIKLHVTHVHHIDQALERKLDRFYHSLDNKLGDIMTKISDFAAQMKDFNDRQDKAVADLQDDIDNLNEKITELQKSGDISTEDQASLAAIQAHGSAISDKLDALDGLTPPVVPVVDPGADAGAAGSADGSTSTGQSGS